MVYFISLITTVVVLLGVQSVLQWGWILSYLLSVNVAVGLLMAYDKLAAKQGTSRIPENLLHLYALIGGTPFAYLSQQLFRHKTIKRSFKKTFHFILFFQILLIALAVLWKYGYL